MDIFLYLRFSCFLEACLVKHAGPCPVPIIMPGDPLQALTIEVTPKPSNGLPDQPEKAQTVQK